MEGFEGMPKQSGENDQPNAVPNFSRASMELSGENAHPQNLRTYQSDLADTIKSGEGSMVKIAMAENARKEREIANFDPNSGKNKLYIAGTIALIIVALVIIVYALYAKTPKTVPITQTAAGLVSIITVDSNDPINIAGLSTDNVREQLGKEYADISPTLNTIDRIVPFTQAETAVQHILTTQEFFSAIGSSIPSQLLRSLNPAFTMGVHAYNGNGLFFAFRTDSYTTALAGMLSWEQSLLDETYKIFNISAAGDNAGLFTAKWKDKVIENQDARALLDAKGNIVLFYAFLGEDKGTLVIADKESTLVEILNRLTSNTLRH